VAIDSPPTERPPSGLNAAIGPAARWRQTALGDYLGEFFGTFVLIVFGCGVVATTVAALTQSGRTQSPFVAGGDWLIITLGWAFAVTFAIYVAGGVSGAHINPAVTIAFALRRGFPWAKVPGYIISQVAGAFVGAALVYWLFFQAIDAYEVANKITRDGGSDVGIFVTGPAQYFSTYWGPILTEIVGTAFLLIFVFAVIDLMNTPPRANMGPLIIGFAVFAIGTSLGAGTGYAINPARDFGPRILAFIEGWGDAAFPGKQGQLDAYWWVPIVAPIIGAIIGAIVYDFVINYVLRARMKPETMGVEQRGEVVEEE
jgi:glycerol uptake facilitator protein